MENIVFEPKILKWAREKNFGLRIENLSAKLKSSWKTISLDTIASWESGKTQPTFQEVKRLAEIYKRPLAVFFLDMPPGEKGDGTDFRTIGSKDNSDMSPKGLLAIRKARRIQEIAAGLYEETGSKLTFKYSKYSLDHNPQDLAAKIRLDFNISLSDQFKKGKYEDFFEYLRLKIEDTGIITLKSALSDSFPIGDCRAFSFADVKPYLILINNKDYEGAKNFSLAHEFAHILLCETGVCNDFKVFEGGDSHINKVEIFCNKFAASFLVPKDIFLNHNLLKGETNIDKQELDDIVNKLSYDFKVSRVVILRRLLTFNLIENKTYRDKIEIWDKDVPFKKQKGGQFSFTTIIKKNGKSYSSLVIDAYHKNKIPASSVSEYLGLKRRYVSGFIDTLHLYDS